jgi:hypothetical protein
MGGKSYGYVCFAVFVDGAEALIPPCSILILLGITTRCTLFEGLGVLEHSIYINKQVSSNSTSYIFETLSSTRNINKRAIVVGSDKAEGSI